MSYVQFCHISHQQVWDHRFFRANPEYRIESRKWLKLSCILLPQSMIDNINKKNTKYTLNEVIENTIQAPSDRQVIIDNAVKKGIVGDGEDTLSISSYSTKKTMCNINNKTISGQ